MRTWQQKVDISKNKVDKKLQEMTINQSWIQQDISGRTDIKLWGGAPAWHAPRVIMGTCKNQLYPTQLEEAPRILYG